MEFEWEDGDGFTLKSTDINYSDNIDLTLNNYETTDLGYVIIPAHIQYAKEQFNIIYDWLTQDMARFK